MLIAPLNCFADVEAKYLSTKPLVSKNFTKEDDLRPIGKRSRKMERIAKINDDCYALMDGGMGDPLFHKSAGPLAPELVARYAPIVWRRNVNGGETVTIRNGAGEKWSHQFRYSFLRRALPRQMLFTYGRSNGKHYIRVNGEDYYLPKTRSIPAAVISNYPKHNFTYEDDGLSVTFRRATEGWVLVGDRQKETVLRERVNVDAKKELKRNIEDLRKWAFSMFPMMRERVGEWEFRQEQNKKAEAWAEENMPELARHFTSWSSPFRAKNTEPEVISFVRGVFLDKSHPLWFTMATCLLTEMRDAEQHAKFSGEAAQATAIKSAFRRWINATLGLTYQIKEKI